MSIKDPEYYLPIVWPEMYHETLGSGANKPMLITGVDEKTGQSDDYVVKIKAGERMGPDASFRELLACFLAMEVGIPVVKPAAVNIDNEFVLTVNDREENKRLQSSIGLNFGSTYVKNKQVIPKNGVLNDKQVKYGLDIFWFDMLIQNLDRTFEKQNLFSSGNEIIIFDHELAFSFLILIGGDPEPWVVTRNKLGNWNDLFLPSKIHKKKINADDISERLDKLEDKFWNKAEELIPTDWYNEVYFNKIKHHIELVRSHKENFIHHLQMLLS